MASSSYKALHKQATTLITGEFNVRVKKVEPTKNSKQNSMFKMQWVVEDGPHQGHTFYSNINVSPDSSAAMRMFFGHMAILGADEAFFTSLPDDLTQEQQDDLIAQKIDGARAVIEVGNRPWQGVDREDVKAIKKPGAMTGGVASPMAGMTGGGATVAAPQVQAATPTLPPSPMAPSTPPPATPY
jgi:hypothetical protein